MSSLRLQCPGCDARLRAGQVPPGLDRATCPRCGKLIWLTAGRIGLDQPGPLPEEPPPWAPVTDSRPPGPEASQDAAPARATRPLTAGALLVSTFGPAGLLAIGVTLFVCGAALTAGVLLCRPAPPAQVRAAETPRPAPAAAPKRPEPAPAPAQPANNPRPPADPAPARPPLHQNEPPAAVPQAQPPARPAPRPAAPPNARNQFLQLMAQGNQARLLGQLNNALAAYRAALQLFPNDPDALRAIQQVQNDIANAAAAAQQAQANAAAARLQKQNEAEEEEAQRKNQQAAREKQEQEERMREEQARREELARREEQARRDQEERDRRERDERDKRDRDKDDKNGKGGKR